MIKIQIAVRKDGAGAQRGKMARVHKTVIENGRIVAKYGLSGLTGEWIEVPEAARYPDECILPLPVVER